MAQAYGIQRTYPNVLNFEGVKGLENAKWEPIVNGAPLHNFPRYDVTAPYLRMLIGPMDYTPGATMNATRETFRAVNDHPMSQVRASTRWRCTPSSKPRCKCLPTAPANI